MHRRLRSPVASTTQVASAKKKPWKRSSSPRAYGYTIKLLTELDKEPKNRTNPADADLARKFKTKEPAYSAALDKLAKAVGERDKYAHTTTRVMVMEDMPTTRPTYVLVKGAYDKHTDEVHACCPANSERGCWERLPDWGEAHGPYQELGAGQRWLDVRRRIIAHGPRRGESVSLAARYFGVGIVKTMEDFGVQGERPVNQGTARLAGGGISRKSGTEWQALRLERQRGDAETDGDERRLSSRFARDAGDV